MRVIAIVFRKIGSLFYIISRKIHPDLFTKKKLNEFEKELLRFNKDNGIMEHQFNYSISKNDVVIDLGGYLGEWSAQIYANYQCNIYVFEPHPIFYKTLSRRYNQNKKITSFQFGLSDSEKTAFLNTDDFKSSIHANHNNSELVEIKLRPFDVVMKELGNPNVTLLKINIEGAEYDLIDYIITSGYISKIQNIQVQFHNFVEDSDVKLSNIHAKLSLTHRPTYQYKYVWENWTIK